jgi:tellurite resistance protein TerC
VAFSPLSGWDLGAQYFAGYIVEESLSIDNLFVFLIIITAVAVPAEQQAKAIRIGITIALALRTIFIVAGATLLRLPRREACGARRRTARVHADAAGADRHR